MSNIAVILAGGSGMRVGANEPKQFLKVAGKRVVEHTIDVFEHNSGIDEIALVCRPDYIDIVEQMVVADNYRKVKKILPGGQERYHSSLSAIAAYSNDSDVLLFHDAVRPLVSDEIVNDCLQAMQRYDAVAVAVPSTDTIFEVDNDGFLVSIPRRQCLRRAQTPQCFKRGVIKRAYDRAMADPGFSTTDDCGVVLRYVPEVAVKIIAGDETNMKVTYRNDLFWVDRLLRHRSAQSGNN